MSLTNFTKEELEAELVRRAEEENAARPTEYELFVEKMASLSPQELIAILWASREILLDYMGHEQEDFVEKFNDNGLYSSFCTEIEKLIGKDLKWTDRYD